MSNTIKVLQHGKFSSVFRMKIRAKKAKHPFIFDQNLLRNVILQCQSEHDYGSFFCPTQFSRKFFCNQFTCLLYDAQLGQFSQMHKVM